ncbi:MAG: TadE family protein [Pirellulaceae bacterium]|nr:TadE family protein [Pirellulaceae bacterium]
MFFKRQTKKSKSARNRSSGMRIGIRRGIATLETAVTLPLVAFLTFGSLELSNMMYLRQSMTIAAYEGVRSATKPGGSQALSDLRIQEMMTARGVTNYTVQYSPAVTTTLPRGTMVQVTVNSPSSNLSYAPFRLFSGTTISSSTTMVRQ